MIKITSLEQLKAWNANPTEEKPIVLEWFLDWFFRELVDRHNYKEADAAIDTLIEFTMKCEGYDEEHAKEVARANLSYYAARWEAGLKTVYQRKALSLDNGVFSDLDTTKRVPTNRKEYRKGLITLLKQYSLTEIVNKVGVPEDKILEYLKEKP